MFTLIDVTTSVANAQTVQAVIEQCCLETGDLLIGSRPYVEQNETVFFVMLMQPSHLTKHLAVLDGALQQGVIASFQPSHYERMVAIAYSDTCVGVQDFPLHPGEAWVPDVADEQYAYLFTRRLELAPEQFVWLQEHEVVTNLAGM